MKTERNITEETTVVTAHVATADIAALCEITGCTMTEAKRAIGQATAAALAGFESALFRRAEMHAKVQIDMRKRAGL